MSGFKLLGILTKDRVDTKEYSDVTDYLKVLKDNTFYGFYSNYKLSKDGNILTVDAENEIDLYSTKENGLKINISAIVGKNGSGKSTLLELLYLASYNLGCKYGLLEEWVPSKTKKFDKNCKPIIEGENETCESLNLNFDILFEKSSSFYSLQFRDKKIKLVLGEIKKDNKIHFGTENHFKLDKKEELSKLFYSIAINYSIYGLNSNTLGKWVKPLFHKNDGYKTPIVINPMRTEGNFDINDEMEFANYRLLNNLLIERYLNNKETIKREIFVTEKQYVKNIKFTFNKNKVKKYSIEDKGVGLSGEPVHYRLLRDLYTVFFGEQEIDIINTEIPYRNEISNYLTQKVDKIIDTYEQYKDSYSYDENNLSDEKRNTNFFNKLKDDKSHITFKIRQAINFYKNCIEQNNEIKKSEIARALEEDTFFEFSLDELINWMNFTDISDVINHIPPSIFSIEILLSDVERKNKPSCFSDLSSGEQQLIHSIQSVLYHFNNIQSIHYSGYDRLCYEYINIVFDEIELYFHPEYQCKFINELLNSFKRLHLGENDKRIKAINIIFSTHSPFILSDIPVCNTLRIDNGKVQDPPTVNTFGANIYDLLADNFFMDEGFIGNVAMNKIDEILNYINNEEYVEENNVAYMTLSNIISDNIISTKLSSLLIEKEESFFDNLSELDLLKRERANLDRKIKEIDTNGYNSK